MSKKNWRNPKASLDTGESDITHEDHPTDREKRIQELITIKIALESYQNITGFFPIADIKTQCSFDGKNIGETPWLPVNDDEYHSIDETFSLILDKNSAKEIDKLISLPGLLTVIQTKGSHKPDLYGQLQIDDEFSNMSASRSLESVISMYEAFTEQRVSISDFPDQNLRKNRKSKKGRTKNPKKSKERTSRDSETFRREPNSPMTFKQSVLSSQIQLDTFSEAQEDPIVYGMCTIDFLPLFHGKQSFSETLLIRPVRKYDDEKMISYKAYPKIVVTVSTKENFHFQGSTLMNITVESIYNLPHIVRPEMDYKISVMLPKEVTQKVPISLTNAHYTSMPSEEVNLCWPSMQKVGMNANTTKYKLSTDNDQIYCKFTENISDYLKEANPRLNFNMIKRTLIMEGGMIELSEYIKIFRKIMLEFHMTQRRELSSPSMKFSNEAIKKVKQPSSAHLMAALDVSPLLYPGVRRVRVACPLTTFIAEETIKNGNLDDFPTTASVKGLVPVKDITPSKEILSKKEKIKGKEKDSEKTARSSVKGTDKGLQDRDLRALLPPKPEEPHKSEPALPLTNEKGKICFVVVEIELSQPIVPGRDLDDLRDEMHLLLQEKPKASSKVVLCSRLTKSYYRELMNALAHDISEKFQRFLEEHPKYRVLSYTTLNFVGFLQSIGAYHTYTSSITRAATLLVTNRFRFDANESKRKSNQNFLQEVFVYLMSEMNDTLNQMISNGVQQVRDETILDEGFFYSKECSELGDVALAERYLLERICRNRENPDYWFDYAVYFLDRKNNDRAYECLKEALLKNPNHKNSLMAMGVILDRKGQKEEAETCLLNLMIQAPKWLEGWGVLYIFYQKHDSYEGMDVSIDMAKQCSDDVIDYFAAFEDLAWTSKICPKSIFFRTAMTLMKMRLYDWAEIALSEEINEYFGMVHYLLGAICYYRGLYAHALEHTQEAKNDHGQDYAVAALSGHCLLALDRKEEAKIEYYHALSGSERPNDMHLVYVNCAKILRFYGDDQEARKFMLLACKYHSTPYTWLHAGLLYLQQNDLLSAEECFTEGNLKDPRNAEIWGNLCLVNLKLRRPHEAEICYQQAIYNKLSNIELLKAIGREIEESE